jgi:hypothetical protein
VASDLQRIAQGLLDSLDENLRAAVDLRNAASQCQELAALLADGRFFTCTKETR